MKFLKLVMFLSLFNVTAFAQSGSDTVKYINDPNYGVKFKRVKVLRAFIAPADTTLNKLGVAVRNGVLYLGNGTYWASVGGLSGVVGISNGGTNITTYTTGDLIYASATNVLSKRAAGTNGYILAMSGGLPVWVNPTTLTTLPYIKSGGTTNATSAMYLNSAAYPLSFEAYNWVVGDINGDNFASITGDAPGERIDYRAGNAGHFFTGPVEFTHAFFKLNNAGFAASRLLTTDGSKYVNTGAIASSVIANTVNDETGTNKVVFSDNPTLVGPALGTPSAVVLTNATGFPYATGGTGILSVGNGGTGLATLGTNRVPYGNNTSAFQSSANLLFDGSLQTITALALGTTQDVAKGLLLANTTAAANSAQQISPAVHWQGKGWKTNSVAASQSVDFRADVLPEQGAANPNGRWRLASSINGGSYTERFGIDNAGAIYVNGSAGAANYYLRSAGPNVAPNWVDISSIFWNTSGSTVTTGCTINGGGSPINIISNNAAGITISDNNTGIGDVGNTANSTKVTVNDVSKEIQIGTASSGTTLHADGIVMSGTYTPEWSNEANANSITAFTCQYSRVGNVVTVSGKISLEALLPGNVIVVRAALPIDSPGLTSEEQVAGTVNCRSQVSPGVVYVNPSRIGVYIDIPSPPLGNFDYFFTYTYIIIPA